MSDETLRALITSLPAILAALAVLIGAITTALFKKVDAVAKGVAGVHDIVNSNNKALVTEVKDLNDRIATLAGDKATLVEQARDKGGT